VSDLGTDPGMHAITETCAQDFKTDFFKLKWDTSRFEEITGY